MSACPTHSHSLAHLDEEDSNDEEEEVAKKKIVDQSDVSFSEQDIVVHQQLEKFGSEAGSEDEVQDFDDYVDDSDRVEFTAIGEAYDRDVEEEEENLDTSVHVPLRSVTARTPILSPIESVPVRKATASKKSSSTSSRKPPQSASSSTRKPSQSSSSSSRKPPQSSSSSSRNNLSQIEENSNVDDDDEPTEEELERAFNYRKKSSKRSKK